MIELRISETAARAIFEQADFFRDSQDNALAAKWESSIDDAVRSLLKWPERGAPSRFRHAQLSGLRWILVPGFPKHLVFYRYAADRQVLLIVHVLHGARDLEAILGESS